MDSPDYAAIYVLQQLRCIFSHLAIFLAAIFANFTLACTYDWMRTYVDFVSVCRPSEGSVSRFAEHPTEAPRSGLSRCLEFGGGAIAAAALWCGSLIDYSTTDSIRYEANNTTT